MDVNTYVFLTKVREIKYFPKVTLSVGRELFLWFQFDFFFQMYCLVYLVYR